MESVWVPALVGIDSAATTGPGPSGVNVIGIRRVAPGANFVPAGGYWTAKTEPAIGLATCAGGTAGPAVAPPGMVVVLLDTMVEGVLAPELGEGAGPVTPW